MNHASPTRPVHFLRLAEHLTSANAALTAMTRTTSARALDVFADPTHAGMASLKQLWALTYREAQTMTYSDAFVMIAICFGLATAMVPLMRKVAPRGAPVADAH